MSKFTPRAGPLSAAAAKAEHRSSHWDSVDMAETKVVLFSFWGVAVSSRPHVLFRKFEELHNLPRGFLSNVASQKDGAMMRAERGQMTFSQAVWLDVDEDGVKAAEAAGMRVVTVNNLDDALDQLAKFTGVQAVSAETSPASCSPEEVSHGYVTIRPGVRTHYVEMGSGPPVLLCHGFPESWFSWRFQIPAMAAAGFRVLALDMKGYGESTAPPEMLHLKYLDLITCESRVIFPPTDIEEYSQEQLCKDLIKFLDKMAIPQVTLVGHDWGGFLVWTMAQYFPERVRAVASLNTPLFPVDPSVHPAERMKAEPVFDYQLYFQKPGTRTGLTTEGVCARGGLFVGLPEQFPRSSMLTEADLSFYVSQFKELGFRRPLNWYRNGEVNWKWMCSRPKGKVPNLSRGHIEECGHWTQMEKPGETNIILISWLKETHEKTGAVTVAPKL
ncbi:hypothetical protein F2P81_002705 [Scophthalmus maximus]|uniref:AB hydrolase-1 domain-containing protein n=1 Tax=Scophthalmus maximus TaxID=52904 RepID=A0A6A4TF34_SCOMX|nr:hypothetical protein F2P81_002705 [Scophthalmus maximus]